MSVFIFIITKLTKKRVLFNHLSLKPSIFSSELDGNILFLYKSCIFVNVEIYFIRNE